uniref:Thioredoxin domain-containing protein n=1 Tax=Gongylonema pulchrum TaxID=637853 RepID=A0A183EEM0_9BILA
LMWYGEEKSYARTGYMDVSSIADFIDDARNPAVAELSPEDFEAFVLEPSEEIWVVDFFAPWCGPCNQLAPEFKKLARNMRRKDFVHFGMVDCDEYKWFCSNLGIHAYPTIRLYSSGSYTADYPSNWWRDHRTMEAWLISHLPSKVMEMGGDFYAQVLDNDEPWLIDFFVSWCSHCVDFAPVFEHIAEMLEGRVKLAKINCDSWPNICHAVGVKAYPTLRFYGGARGGHIQKTGGIPIQSQNADTVVQLVENELNKAKKLLKTEL